MTIDVRTITITEAARLLATGQITSEALTHACLETIAARPDLNAFVVVFEESAIEAARNADRELAAGRARGALHGIPISIKDLIDMRGVRTSAASRVREAHVATADAPVIDRLREAGAVIVGKTNLHEFAFGTTSEESAFGPVRNPFDTSRVAGGSSGGSAVAVQTGMSLASIGTDTGGSIRIPAAACGVVGLKPTYGEVSADLVVPLSRSLDHVGPLARSVADAAIMFDALVGRPPELRAPTGSVSGLKIGIPRGYLFDVLDDEVRDRINEAFERLRGAGAVLVDVPFPDGHDIAAIYLHIQLPEASAYHATTLDASPDLYTTSVRLRLEMGRYVLAEDYVRALRGRDQLRAAVDTALDCDGCDALALAAVPIPAPPIGASTVTVGGGRTEPVRAVMLRLTQPFNLTGHPAIAIPCGLTAAGLPCSMQLVGRRHRTDDLLRAALRCERYVAVGTGMSGGGTG
jgi:aspartyl-tRNA(Asn)/glutamyl-tRNA(Gln) amidotransferase subunit A